MLSLILGSIKSLFSAIGGIFEWLSSERLRKLGHLEAEQEQQAQEKLDETIAREIDARPVPRNKSDILTGLRKPSN